ncbi:unnamed protein product [Mytilus coruscus]|uniref:Uncharacterized protein n=1 Tax=Mytilus coruscus TaxID=42192 RepID=A0A6J8B8X7_MYTCO|nr:unnamed protein product [Mytilus coruscus]
MADRKKTKKNFYVVAKVCKRFHSIDEAIDFLNPSFSCGTVPIFDEKGQSKSAKSFGHVCKSCTDRNNNIHLDQDDSDTELSEYYDLPLDDTIKEVGPNTTSTPEVVTETRELNYSFDQTNVKTSFTIQNYTTTTCNHKYTCQNCVVVPDGFLSDDPQKMTKITDSTDTCCQVNTESTDFSCQVKLETDSNDSLIEKIASSPKKLLYPQ